MKEKMLTLNQKIENESDVQEQERKKCVAIQNKNIFTYFVIFASHVHIHYIDSLQFDRS